MHGHELPENGFTLPDVVRILSPLSRMSEWGSKFHIYWGRLDMSIKLIIVSALIPIQQDQFFPMSGLYIKRQLFSAFFIVVCFTAYWYRTRSVSTTHPLYYLSALLAPLPASCLQCCAWSCILWDVTFVGSSTAVTEGIHSQPGRQARRGECGDK